MYGIYGNIYHQYTPNVSIYIYTIHGSYGRVNPGLPTISQAVAHQLTELPIRSNLPDNGMTAAFSKKTVFLVSHSLQFFGVGFEAKQFWRFNVQSKDTTQDLSIPWPMKIWWSMPSDAWPWWFLNPHENLRNNIIDWYVFLGIHFTVSPEVLSVLVLEPWKGKIHLRTGNLLPPVSSAARNFGQIHFTSQTCPQGQKIRNSHDAVQTGKTPWINTCELCEKKRAEQQISKQENRTVTVGRCVFLSTKRGKNICIWFKDLAL